MKKPTNYLFLLLTVLLVNCNKENPVDPGSANDPLAPTVTSVSPSVGTLGDKVVITGSNFSPNLTDNMVKFGDVYARLEVASPTRLETRVPKDADRCKVVVQVNGKKGVSGTFFDVRQIFPKFNGHGEEANVLDNLTPEFVRATSTLDEVGSRKIMQHGHVWSDDGMPPFLDDNTRLGGYSEWGVEPKNNFTELGPGYDSVGSAYSFTSYLEGLKPATTYRLSAYIVTKDGITYGPVSEFRTPAKAKF